MAGDSSVGPLFSTGPETEEDREAVIFGDMKYTRYLYTLQEELYDLANDPGERRNMVISSDEIVLQARALLRDDRESQNQHGALHRIARIDERTLDEATIERLRALGYLR